MKRVVFEDLYELSSTMIDEYKNHHGCVSAICHYDIAIGLLSEIIQSDIPIGQINICDYSWNGYDKEYAIHIMDECVYCSPVFGDSGKYLETYSDIAFVHQDCNSKFLRYLDCEKVYEFSVRDLDDEDGYELNDDDVVLCNSSSVTVNKDKLSKPTGFTKTWTTTDGNGLYQYSSYSYHCSNEDMLRTYAKRLDIEL